MGRFEINVTDTGAGRADAAGYQTSDLSQSHQRQPGGPEAASYQTTDQPFAPEARAYQTSDAGPAAEAYQTVDQPTLARAYQTQDNLGPHAYQTSDAQGPHAEAEAGTREISPLSD